MHTLFRFSVCIVSAPALLRGTDQARGWWQHVALLIHILEGQCMLGHKGGEKAAQFSLGEGGDHFPSALKSVWCLFYGLGEV